MIKADRNCIQQIFGALMQHPQYLSEVDKYSLSLTDFTSRFDAYIFSAISGLYLDGNVKIHPIDIENYLSSDQLAASTFEKQNGIEFLQDSEDLSDYTSFPFYYNYLKKINLLRDLQKSGFDVSSFYCEDLAKPNAYEINSRFNELSVSDIVDTLKKKILAAEKNYVKTDETETQTIAEGIEELIEGFDAQEELGLPVQGEIFTEVMGGARRGALMIRSASSGLGKSRNAVADAAYLAFPFRYNSITCQWERIGFSEKVLFIATEQQISQIQKMVLAYITDINEDRFKYGHFSQREEKVLKQAVQIMKEFEDNFLVMRIPNPTIDSIKALVRENVILHDVGYVFYDYIFIGPALLNEFKGHQLRNDELLLLMATALKDLAVELNVFVATSTQVNANADNNENIRNESSLAGGRSTINKADFGCICARPTKDELEVLKDLIDRMGGVEPNLVTDVYKVREGSWTQTRIWSKIDLGTLKKVDLFITDSKMYPVEGFSIHSEYNMVNWDEETDKGYAGKIRKLNEELV